MQKPTHKTPKTPSPLVWNLAFMVLRRVFSRVFSLSLYSIVAVPWLLVLFEKTQTEHQSLRNGVYEIIRLLNLRPAGAELHATDIVRAMAIIFLIINIVIELMNLGHKINSKDHVKRYLKRNLILRVAISSAGWLTAAWVLRPTGGSQAVVICLVLMLVTPVFFTADFIIYWTINYIKKTNLWLAKR